MRHLYQCQSNHADVPVRSPRRVSKVLRQDDPDGRLPASPTTALRHLPCQDPQTQANVAEQQEQPPAAAAGRDPPSAVRQQQQQEVRQQPATQTQTLPGQPVSPSSQ